MAAVKLDIELVPTPLWGESLYRLLTRGQWDKIRRPVLDRAAGHCEVCGAASARLQCHEQWEYQDDAGRRVLTSIQAVCGQCNAAIHIGRAGIAAAEGHVDMQGIYDHFTRVNGIDWPTAKKAKVDAFGLHQKRSQRKWTTDYGPYAEQIAARRAAFPDGRIPTRK